MIELPAELLTLRERGSSFTSEPLILYLYCWPALAVEMSADQSPPLASLVRGLAVPLQPLKSPSTVTLVASGTHTRKVTPVPPASEYGIDPMPGRLDWAEAGRQPSDAAKKHPANRWQ